MKKKIAVFVNSLEIGGTESVTLVFVNELIKYNFTVDLILLQKKGYYLKFLDKRVNVVNLDKKRLLFSFFNFFKYLKKNNPDIILSHLTHINVFVLFFKIFLKMRFKIFINETTTVSLKKKHSNKFRHSILNLIIPFFYPKAAKVIVPSLGVKQDLINTYKVKNKKIAIIPNPVDINFIKSQSKKKINLRIKKKIPLLVSMGRLIPDKDFLSMIKAVQDTLKIKKIHLLIMGKGIQKNFLNFEIKKNKLNNNIQLLGEIKNPFPILSKAKIFILTSRREGMPTALLQAIALKKMVISTNCPSGPKEIMSKLNCGYLAEVGNVSDIKKGILKGLNNKIKKADHDKFLKNYHISYIIKKYIKTFQKN